MLTPSLQKHSSLRISKNNLLLFLIHSSFPALVTQEWPRNTHISCWAVFCLFLLPVIRDRGKVSHTALKAEPGSRALGQRVQGNADGSGLCSAVCSTANANQKVFPKQSTREHIRAFPVQMNYNLPVCRWQESQSCPSPTLALRSAVAALYLLKDTFKAKTCEGLSAFRKSFWSCLLYFQTQNE